MAEMTVKEVIDLIMQGGVIVVLIIVLWRLEQKYDRLLTVILAGQEKTAKAIEAGTELMAQKLRAESEGNDDYKG